MLSVKKGLFTGSWKRLEAWPLEQPPSRSPLHFLLDDLSGRLGGN